MKQAAYLIKYPSKCELEVQSCSWNNLNITSLLDSVFKHWLQPAITFKPVELQKSACTQIKRLWFKLKGVTRKSKNNIKFNEINWYQFLSSNFPLGVQEITMFSIKQYFSYFYLIGNIQCLIREGLDNTF